MIKTLGMNVKGVFMFGYCPGRRRFRRLTGTMVIAAAVLTALMLGGCRKQTYQPTTPPGPQATAASPLPTATTPPPTPMIDYWPPGYSKEEAIYLGGYSYEDWLGEMGDFDTDLDKIIFDAIENAGHRSQVEKLTTVDIDGQSYPAVTLRFPDGDFLIGFDKEGAWLIVPTEGEAWWYDVEEGADIPLYSLPDEKQAFGEKLNPGEYRAVAIDGDWRNDPEKAWLKIQLENGDFGFVRARGGDLYGLNLDDIPLFDKSEFVKSYTLEDVEKIFSGKNVIQYDEFDIGLFEKSRKFSPEDIERRNKMAKDIMDKFGPLIGGRDLMDITLSNIEYPVKIDGEVSRCPTISLVYNGSSMIIFQDGKHTYLIVGNMPKYGPAFVMAREDVEYRAGPGEDYPVIGRIPKTKKPTKKNSGYPIRAVSSRGVEDGWVKFEILEKGDPNFTNTQYGWVRGGDHGIDVIGPNLERIAVEEGPDMMKDDEIVKMCSDIMWPLIQPEGVHYGKPYHAKNHDGPGFDVIGPKGQKVYLPGGEVVDVWYLNGQKSVIIQVSENVFYEIGHLDQNSGIDKSMIGKKILSGYHGDMINDHSNEPISQSRGDHVEIRIGTSEQNVRNGGVITIDTPEKVQEACVLTMLARQYNSIK